MQEINTEKIMEEIRKEIKEKGFKDSDLSFNDIPISSGNDLSVTYSEKELQNHMHAANLSCRVDYYKPIDGGIKGAFKKLVRKLIKPIVLHLCEEQEHYNSETIQTINQLYEYTKLLEERITKLEKIIKDME